ncbi:hypothetical protein [Haloferula sp.]|uniref:hypothetical protein n=1 Tax=Haloferula sp. TaxID=2497595 RepID=UPI00329B8FD1
MTIIEDIMGYAVRGGGKYILLICTVLSGISAIAGFAPGFGWVAQWLLFGYFCALYFKVIETSATGSDEAPEFPEISSLFEDVVQPAFKVIAISAVCFGPAYVYEMVSGNGEVAMITMGLKAFGYTYFPMAMMAVVCLGYLGAMSPHIVVPSILRAGGLYWLAVFLLGMLGLAEDFIAAQLSEMPLLFFVVMTLVGAYLLLTNGRILGIIYRERREEMNWV